MLEILLDTLKDSLKLLPFLFLTFLLMEYLEHKMSDKTKKIIKKAGKAGPLYGAVLGAFPQCGFSAAASSLYCGRIITLGTLIAIYLSTSDEMLPILISENVGIIPILKILGLKVLIGIIVGFIIDFVYIKIASKKENIEEEIGHLCEEEKCHCEENGILKSSIKHTVSIISFIFLTSLILNIIVHIVGEENLSKLILNKPIIGQVISGIFGLIPNCASSVIITSLYLKQIINLGAMMSGLLVGAGVGILILFKENKSKKESLKIIGLLYLIGVISGIIIELIGIQI